MEFSRKQGRIEQLSWVFHSPNYSLIYNHYMLVLISLNQEWIIAMLLSGWPVEVISVEADWTSPICTIPFTDLVAATFYDNQLGHFPVTQVQFLPCEPQY